MHSTEAPPEARTEYKDSTPCIFHGHKGCRFTPMFLRFEIWWISIETSYRKTTRINLIINT